jgi:hypothetical protein
VQFLPNSGMRICTTHLKIRPFRKNLPRQHRGKPSNPVCRHPSR